MSRSRGMHAVALLTAALGLGGGCSAKEPPPGDSARADTAPVVAASLPDTAPPAGAPPESAVSPGTAPVPGAERTPPAGAPARPVPPARATSAAPQAPADTVRGIVAEVGSQPMTSIVVRPSGGRSVPIVGPLAAEIRRAAGAEVWVSGSRGPAGLDAARYAVRSVDGQVAIDGTLAADGNGLVLVTPSGRRAIARPPAALRGMIGARVWLVGALDGPIASYGVLREPPQ